LHFLTRARAAVIAAAISGLVGVAWAAGVLPTPNFAGLQINGNTMTFPGVAATLLYNGSTAGGDLTGTLPSPTIAANAVTNSKAAQMAANTLKGNNTSAPANALDLTATQVGAMINGAYHNVVALGADPTGSADSSTAFQTAFTTACGSAPGGAVVIPPGTYKLASQITCTFGADLSSVQVIGGGNDDTILDWTAANGGLAVSYSTYRQVSFHVYGLAFATTQNGGGNGLSLSSTASAGTQGISDINNVTFRGMDGYALNNYWTVGISVINVSNININSVMITGGGGSSGFVGGYCTGTCGNGLVIAGGSGSFATAINVINSYFNYLSEGIGYGAATQGVTITNTNFTGGNYGVAVGSTSTSAYQLNIGQSQFNCAGYGILIQSSVPATMIIGNTFIDPTGSTGISITASARGTISNNEFASLTGSPATNNGIVIAGYVADGMVVSDNVLSNLTTGIWLTSSSQYANVVDNILSSNTNAIVNSGTNNRSINNQGYNPVGTTSAASTGSTGSTITAGASPETHYIKQSANFNAAVVKNSQAICTVATATVPCVVELGPHESYVVNWSTTQPTYTKDVH
jgi:hypothetical protein